MGPIFLPLEILGPVFANGSHLEGPVKIVISKQVYDQLPLSELGKLEPIRCRCADPKSCEHCGGTGVLWQWVLDAQTSAQVRENFASQGIELGKDRDGGTMDETEIRHRCFMDGIDWQHHLEADASGTALFPSVESLKERNPHIETGGCGVVEVEVRLIRWVDAQNLKFLR
jgi:hypothetical protein